MENYERELDDAKPSENIPEMSAEEKISKCRERNRFHAKNTRERKKVQMGTMQARLQSLITEKAQLSKEMLKTSVDDILLNMSDQSCSETHDTSDENSSVEFVAQDTISLTNMMSGVVKSLTENDDYTTSPECDSTYLHSLPKDKTELSTEQLETMRRERSRIHAKKTRLRKKKMIQEMENTMSKLEAEVLVLRNKANNKRSYSHDQKSQKRQRTSLPDEEVDSKSRYCHDAAQMAPHRSMQSEGTFPMQMPMNMNMPMSMQMNDGY
eukprot:CAMPEP_0182418472 /NCGR_PEP_ID=MMETSP1167-20130531/2894_1 /TAXON_ID=2988 /ORGANISM="Mallomonas Sp, Strain CCMP3275" /LENGTH=266 /DNA_ID=CAMNT_0024592691 /DNA_START=29 /DNA_END=826 /DNA_ORIENTATION=+